MRRTQQDRLEWLEHALGDSDCGRLYSRTQMIQMNEERELLRELRSAAEPKVFDNCNVCGRKLHTEDEDAMGMCAMCADE